MTPFYNIFTDTEVFENSRWKTNAETYLRIFLSFEFEGSTWFYQNLHFFRKKYENQPNLKINPNIKFSNYCWTSERHIGLVYNLYTFGQWKRSSAGRPTWPSCFLVRGLPATPVAFRASQSSSAWKHKTLEMKITGSRTDIYTGTKFGGGDLGRVGGDLGREVFQKISVEIKNG